MEKQTVEEEEYVTFTVISQSGDEVELALVDEFDFEFRHYVVGARIIDDVISEEGQYIYRAKITGDDFVPEKITDAKEYEKVIKAYMAMED